jgi:chromosome segregation protein
MKLTKLILSGFKSFADRTAFDFDEGVSCVVGPNGCGKSNIVDAFKWVLGEQSAKSLRGSEMQDVIFNGSSTRKPAGLAEVTLVFDNSTGLLQPEVGDGGNGDGNGDGDHIVSVTRRLYRSGASEYLINKAPCRLRDIREMFMDTGVGRRAYSLIEQGRVEAFLQASHDERRAVFDEAAGISKYKARKAEALRKLDRVEQNLLRLNDILAEVDKRLRSIKYQAGKARNYQTYTERLNGLRSLHVLARYHQLRGQRGELQKTLDAENDKLAGIHTRIDQLESARSSTEVESVDLERAARDLQSRIAAVGGRITSCEQRVEMLTGRVEELGEQVAAEAHRCEEAEAKIDACRGEIDARERELAEVTRQADELDAAYGAAREEHGSAEMAITHLTARLEDEKAGTIDLLRQTAQLHNEIHGLGIKRENLHSQRRRLSDRADQIEQELEQLLTQRSEVTAKLEDVRRVIDASQQKLTDTRTETEQLSGREQQLRDELSDAREQRSALQSRIQALEEMQQRLEGVAAGVRRVLEAKRQGRLDAIDGMLGDAIEADVAHAPLVEAALAGADQLLLAERFDAVRDARAELTEVLGDSGAVEVICLDRLGPLSSDLDLSECPWALARAVDWVRYERQLGPLMWRLLGRTLVVRTLDDARAAAERTPADTRFVTLSGEVLEPDGRVRMGAANRATGVIARRSELAELSGRLEDVDARIAELSRSASAARDERYHLEQVQQQLRTAVYEANTERVQCEGHVARLNEEIDKLRREKPVIADDLSALAEEIDAAVREAREAEQQAGQLEQRKDERQQEIDRLNVQLDAARARQKELADKLTELKVSTAQAEQKKLSVREALDALTRQREQMVEELQAARAQIELNRKRRSDAEQAVEATREEIDGLYAQQQQLNAEAEETEESRRGLQEKSEQIRTDLSEQRKAQEAAAERVNAARVELSEVDVRVDDLIARASEEMHMDLPAAYADYEHDEQRDWDAVADEIQELRGKIERLGNVNLDAITEQEELEKRREFLTGQLDDVHDSQKQLTDLIRRINRQSREMFLDTFQQVRENFQELFRKMFGGGRADVMLLDPDDVLETDIEIVARPPGKELRSLTLLSGGEKTMTAIALMFAFFRAKPSPFCLLDEVDAALDESNNERFNRLVEEFVADSQFIIITHAKRTMGMAGVLYGVTMQEPGVSKRISVRFEEAHHYAEDAPATEAVASGS